MARYLVDGMNVIGSRPDGWWRDLDGAVVCLARSLAAWRAAENIEATAVFDGGEPSNLGESDLGELEVAFAGKGRAADDEIVRLTGIDSDPGSLTVVTSDRALADRVQAAGAGKVLGAGVFRRRLDPYCK